MADLVLDTDVLVDFLRGRSPRAEMTRSALRGARIYVSVVTAYELRVGIAQHAQADLEQQLSGRTLPLDLEAAMVAGRIGGELARTGRRIGAPDELIAGTCVRFGLPLVTHNRKHYERVPGLQLLEI